MERATLVRTSDLHVEQVRYVVGPTPTPAVHAAAGKVVITLAGAFHFHVGRKVWLIDANQVTFVPADEVSCHSFPRPNDVHIVIVTFHHDAPLFAKRTALASTALQVGAARLATGLVAPFEAEALAIDLVRRAVACMRGESPPESAVLLARRARELFDDRGPRLALTEVANELRVSPAHLTHAFCRAEGIPLVRYQLRLRLSRALAEVPHASDLCRLATELGFASHSHFTDTFRRQFGITPSQYRTIASSRVRIPP